MTSDSARLGITDARMQFPSIVDDAAEGKRRFVITCRGQDRCAIVSMADLRRLEELGAGKKPAKAGRK